MTTSFAPSHVRHDIPKEISFGGGDSSAGLPPPPPPPGEDAASIFSFGGLETVSSTSLLFKNVFACFSGYKDEEFKDDDDLTTSSTLLALDKVVKRVPSPQEAIDKDHYQQLLHTPSSPLTRQKRLQNLDDAKILLEEEPEEIELEFETSETPAPLFLESSASTNNNIDHHQEPPTVIHSIPSLPSLKEEEKADDMEVDLSQPAESSSLKLDDSSSIEELQKALKEADETFGDGVSIEEQTVKTENRVDHNQRPSSKKNKKTIVGKKLVSRVCRKALGQLRIKKSSSKSMKTTMENLPNTTSAIKSKTKSEPKKKSSINWVLVKKKLQSLSNSGSDGTGNNGKGGCRIRWFGGYHAKKTAETTALLVRSSSSSLRTSDDSYLQQFPGTPVRKILKEEDDEEEIDFRNVTTTTEATMNSFLDFVEDEEAKKNKIQGDAVEKNKVEKSSSKLRRGNSDSGIPNGKSTKARQGRNSNLLDLSAGEDMAGGDNVESSSLPRFYSFDELMTWINNDDDDEIDIDIDNNNNNNNNDMDYDDVAEAYKFEKELEKLPPEDLVQLLDAELEKMMKQ